MHIDELMINPDGLKTADLVLTKEEFADRVQN